MTGVVFLPCVHAPVRVSAQVSIDEVDDVMGAAHVSFMDLLHAVIAKGTTPLFVVPDLPPKVIGYAKELSVVVEVLTSSSSSHAPHVPECKPSVRGARCRTVPSVLSCVPSRLPSQSRRCSVYVSVPACCGSWSEVHGAVTCVLPMPVCARVPCRGTARPLLVSGARGCGMTFFGTVLAHRVRETPGAFPGGIALVSTLSSSADPRIPLLAVCSAFRIGATEVRTGSQGTSTVSLCPACVVRACLRTSTWPVPACVPPPPHPSNVPVMARRLGRVCTAAVGAHPRRVSQRRR